MRERFAGLAAAVMMMVASEGQALTFKEGGDETMNCVATFEGQFQPGDAERMKTFLGDWWAHNKETYQYNMPRLSICLNSPGGSLSEAVKMADALVKTYYSMSNLGTAVPAGAVCESACAVFFMAGERATQQDSTMTAPLSFREVCKDLRSDHISGEWRGLCASRSRNVLAKANLGVSSSAMCLLRLLPGCPG